MGNPKTAKIFTKNFFADFKVVLGKKHRIKDFAKCDFEPIRKHLNEQKIIRKAITDEEKKANKEERNQFLFKYGYAIVDGHLEKVGNYNMVRVQSITAGTAQVGDELACQVWISNCRPFAFYEHRNPQVPFGVEENIQKWASLNQESCLNRYL